MVCQLLPLHSVSHCSCSVLVFTNFLLSTALSQKKKPVQRQLRDALVFIIRGQNVGFNPWVECSVLLCPLQKSEDYKLEEKEGKVFL